jgi:hypothetical protein
MTSNRIRWRETEHIEDISTFVVAKEKDNL